MHMAGSPGAAAALPVAQAESPIAPLTNFPFQDRTGGAVAKDDGIEPLEQIAPIPNQQCTLTAFAFARLRSWGALERD
jgi:hypothetical protein